MIKEEVLEKYRQNIIKHVYDTEDERWALIEKTNNYYAISTLGRVMNMRDGRIMRTTITNKGYELLVTHVNGEQQGFTVHRLVAEAFIPNPNKLSEVNHIDENPLNNKINNLEWCTHSYNNTYNDLHIRRGEKRRGIPSHNKGKSLAYKDKNVLMLSKNNIVLKVFNSVSEAAHYISENYNKKFTTTFSRIYEVVKGKSNSYLGYKWTMINKI